MVDVARCRITLNGTTGLKAQDPYCVFKIGNSTFKSKIIKDNSPKEKEECVLSASMSDRYLCIDVFDWVRVPGKDEKLGDVMVSLFQFPVHHDHETPVTLTMDLPLRGDGDRIKNPVGRVQFSVTILWLDLDHWAGHQAAAWRLQGWSGHPHLQPSPPQYTLVNQESRYVQPECVEIFLPATVRTPARYCTGLLILSYCRLVFVSDVLKKQLESKKVDESIFLRPKSAISHDLSFSIPLGLLLSIEVDSNNVRLETIDLNCFQVSFPNDQMHLMESFTARIQSHIHNRGDNIVSRELYASASAVAARAKAHAINSSNNSTSNSANSRSSRHSINSSTVNSSHSHSAPPSPTGAKKELTPEPSIVRCPSGSPMPIELESTLRFDFSSEVVRQGLHLHHSISEVKEPLGSVASRNWRLSMANVEYILCPSYPQSLVVPCTIPDEVLNQVGLYRSKGRIPALSYFHRRRGTAITRCAQPLAGLIGKSSDADQQLIQAIRLASPGGKLVIIDARSPAAATGNSFKGAGTENVRDFPGCEMQFMYIGNIHEMRNSFNTVREAVFSDEFLQNLSTAKWLKHLSGVIHGACVMVKLLEEPTPTTACCGIKYETGSDKPCVKCNKPQQKELTGTSCLVHCSDGWDRTAQLCSLSQLLLDPYSRTFDGFRMLVQKDWLSFGHKFYDRLGHVSHPDEESPIFWQWLDCVHQVIVQFPTAFEYTPAYLAVVARFAYSGWCGEFTRNTERERAEEPHTTISFWTLLRPYRHLSNPRYTPTDTVLLPVSSQKALVPWSELFLRHVVFPDDPETDPSEAKGMFRKLKEIIPEQLPSQAMVHVEGLLQSAVQGAQAITQIVKKSDDPDSQCGICNASFTFLRRRRQCPGCAVHICASCSQSVPPSVVQMPDGPDVKVCLECHKAYSTRITLLLKR